MKTSSEITPWAACHRGSSERGVRSRTGGARTTNELSISGEIKPREHKGTVRRSSRRVGRFDYRVTLPSHVDPKKIDAKLSDGVLTVRVPKAEQAQRQRIEVKTA